jgi:superkiller protein 3
VQWVETGVRQWQRFYYVDALKSLDSAIVADSMFAIAWGRAGLVHLYAGNLPDARSAIARASRLAVNATPREQRFIRLWSYRINEKRDLEAALADSLLAMYPEETELYLLRGQCYEFEGNYEAAVRLYSQGVKQDTGFALGIMSLGYAYSVLGDQKKAVEYMQRYIRMAPQEPDPLASYADLLMRAGQYDEALEQYQKALEVKPDYWYAVREIGTVYLVKGRLRDAERQFEEAVKLLPATMQREAGLMRLRGIIDLQRGRYEDAITLFQAVHAIDSTYVGTTGSLTVALSKLKRFDEAWALADSVRAEMDRRKLTGRQLVQGYHLLRTRILLEEGRVDEAERECREAMEASTPLTRGAVYIQLARVYRARKAWEPAIDAIENALSLNPNSPDALQTLALVFHDRGDRQMAAEIGDRLFQLWSAADSDFVPLLELRRALGRKPA